MSDAFASHLLSVIADVQRALGFSDEDVSTANGSDEIVDAIASIKRASNQHFNQAMSNGAAAQTAEARVAELEALRDGVWSVLQQLKANMKLDDPSGHYDIVCETLAKVESRGSATAPAGAPTIVNEGRLWSLLRTVMSQGADIHQDYIAGRFTGYEAYSARLDAAASERTDQLAAALAAGPAAPKTA